MLWNAKTGKLDQHSLRPHRFRERARVQSRLEAAGERRRRRAHPPLGRRDRRSAPDAPRPCERRQRRRLQPERPPPGERERRCARLPLGRGERAARADPRGACAASQGNCVQPRRPVAGQRRRGRPDRGLERGDRHAEPRPHRRAQRNRRACLHARRGVDHQRRREQRGHVLELQRGDDAPGHHAPRCAGASAGRQLEGGARDDQRRGVVGRLVPPSCSALGGTGDQCLDEVVGVAGAGGR